MPTRLKSRIKDVVLWSDREEVKTVYNIPIGTTLVEAWFAIKLNEDDDDAEALMFKTATPIAVANEGHIADVGTFNAGQLGIGRVIFVMPGAELGADLSAPVEYFYSMKGKLSNGKVGEFEQGILNTIPGVVKRLV